VPEEAPAIAPLDVGTLTDQGTERGHNEDAVGSVLEGPSSAIVAVADGVSSAEAGEVASRMAIDVVLREVSAAPRTRRPGDRLYRAFQQANIEIYDKAVAVPELRGMTTTLTAVAVEAGELTIVHVGDSRVYLVRDRHIVQLTKDHTAAAERARLGLLSREKARTHPDRGVLTRSVGRELIVSRDRISSTLQEHDILLLCTDGLYNVLEDNELATLVEAKNAQDGCRALIDAANARGTGDNLSAAIIRVTGPVPKRPKARGILGSLKRLFGVGGR
jgi:protein phosphatase